MNRIHHFDGALLGEAIERAREHRGLNRAQLGRLAGASKAIIQNHENGTTKAFFIQLVEVANALRINSMLLAVAAVHESRPLDPEERCMVVLHPEYWPVRYGKVVTKRSFHARKGALRRERQGRPGAGPHYEVQIYGEAEPVRLHAKYIRRLP